MDKKHSRFALLFTDLTSCKNRLKRNGSRVLLLLLGIFAISANLAGNTLLERVCESYMVKEGSTKGYIVSLSSKQFAPTSNPALISVLFAAAPYTFL